MNNFRNSSWWWKRNEYRWSSRIHSGSEFGVHRSPVTGTIHNTSIRLTYTFVWIYIIFFTFLQAATYLCPAIFPWVDTGPATEESGMFVMKMTGILYILIITFDLLVVCGMDNMNNATTFFLILFLFIIVGICLVISRKPQNR